VSTTLGDDANAVYFLGLDEDGDVLTSLRGRPTHDWALLTDQFADWVHADIDIASLKSPTVWGLDRRLSVGGGRSTEAARRQGPAMRVAYLETALAHGVTRAIGLCDAGLWGYAQSVWPGLRAIGLPRMRPGGGTALAFELAVTRQAVMSLRERHQLAGPVALELEADDPWADWPKSEVEALFRAATAPDLEQRAEREAAAFETGMLNLEAIEEMRDHCERLWEGGRKGLRAS
jgi:N-acyl-L-homoserine lactone synthetase